MKKIGLLGGMSWESTALYYSLLNQLVRERLGGYHSARCLVASVDFAPVEEMQRAGDWEAAAACSPRRLRLLENGGAELLLLCTNTMHKVADRIEQATSVPFVHLADVTARAVWLPGSSRSPSSAPVSACGRASTPTGSRATDSR